MPSPFPGMDPWLETEAGWGGFHQAYIVAVQAELNRLLPDGFRARIDEYVWIQDEAEERRHRFKPDAFIPEPSAPATAVLTAGRPTTAPNYRGHLAARRRKTRHVAVTGPGRRVLTVIEVLSPSNKQAGEDRAAYLRKRREYLATANLIEIDLLRAGERMPTGNPLPPPCDYLMFLCRLDKFPETELWTLFAREPLPILPVPIGEEYPSCPLDLRACLDRVYDESRAAVDIDYNQPPEFPLRPLDAEWAEELLRKHAKRKKK